MRLVLAPSSSVVLALVVFGGRLVIKKRRRRKEVKKIAHFLVPPHELVKEEDEEKILARYGITKDQLPKIRAYDPAISGLEAKEGDMIRIKREGESEYYRVVVRD